MYPWQFFLPVSIYHHKMPSYIKDQLIVVSLAIFIGSYCTGIMALPSPSALPSCPHFRMRSFMSLRHSSTVPGTSAIGIP